MLLITRRETILNNCAVDLPETAGPTLALPALTREFVTIKAHDSVDLYAQLVKPANFDPAVKFPVVVHWYGGPGVQNESD